MHVCLCMCAHTCMHRHMYTCRQATHTHTHKYAHQQNSLSFFLSLSLSHIHTHKHSLSLSFPPSLLLSLSLSLLPHPFLSPTPEWWPGCSIDRRRGRSKACGQTADRSPALTSPSPGWTAATNKNKVHAIQLHPLAKRTAVTTAFKNMKVWQNVSSFKLLAAVLTEIPPPLALLHTHMHACTNTHTHTFWNINKTFRAVSIVCYQSVHSSY